MDYFADFQYAAADQREGGVPTVHPHGARSTPATPLRAASRFRCALNISKVRGGADGSVNLWVLERAAEALLLLRRQPTKRDCTFAAISRCACKNYTAGDVLARRNTANQFRAVLEFGFIFGKNLSKNSRSSVAPQGGGVRSL